MVGTESTVTARAAIASAENVGEIAEAIRGIERKNNGNLHAWMSESRALGSLQQRPEAGQGKDGVCYRWLTILAVHSGKGAILKLGERSAISSGGTRCESREVGATIRPDDGIGVSRESLVREARFSTKWRGSPERAISTPHPRKQISRKPESHRLKM